jgi:hypothetical protein
MHVTAVTQNENTARDRKDFKRPTMTAYLDAKILAAYDCSVEERETHDRMMENYRRDQMRMCALSNEAEVSPTTEVNEE